MSRVRISYLVEDAQNASVTPQNEGHSVSITNLYSAKHVRVVVPGGRPTGGKARVSWARKQVFDVPFDSPAELGLHIDTERGNDWSELAGWLETCGISPGVKIEAANWDTYTAYAEDHPSFKCLEQYGIDLAGATSVSVAYGYDERLPGQVPDDLVIEVFYDWATRTETVDRHGARTEVGILTLDAASDPADHLVYGRVRDLSKQETSSPLMFHHVPIHRRAPGSIPAKAEFLSPYGLHFTLALTIDSEPPQPSCKLYTKLDLPHNIFVDKYQLQDQPRMDPPSALLGVWGETDLEAPEWLVTQGSQALLRLDSKTGTRNVTGSYEIPLHFRYALPTDTLTESGNMVAPLLFWACQEDIPEEHIPGLSYESVFPSDTVFYYLPTNHLPYNIPAISVKDELSTQRITAIVVVVGTLLILIATIRKFFGSQNTSEKLKKE